MINLPHMEILYIFHFKFQLVYVVMVAFQYFLLHQNLKLLQSEKTAVQLAAETQGGGRWLPHRLRGAPPPARWPARRREMSTDVRHGRRLEAEHSVKNCSTDHEESARLARPLLFQNAFQSHFQLRKRVGFLFFLFCT